MFPDGVPWMAFFSRWEPQTRWIAFERSLAPNECDRAAEIPSPSEATRFAAARALLNRFRDTAEGLSHVSVSHAGDCALVGLSDRAIGVDIVDLRRGVWPAVIRLANVRELAALDEVDPEQRQSAAADLWATKEALAKADGRGLRHPFPAIDRVGWRRGCWGDLAWVTFDMSDYRASVAWSGTGGKAAKLVEVPAGELF
jgi:4'-phosphopantetheinyl transferase superfamily